MSELPELLAQYSKSLHALAYSAVSAAIWLITTDADLASATTWIIVFIVVVGPAVGVAWAPANKKIPVKPKPLPNPVRPPTPVEPVDGDDAAGKHEA